MKFLIRLQGDASSKPWRRPWLTHAAAGAVLFACAVSAHAASIYKCVDAHGHLAFQDIPCAAHVQQRKLDLHPLPAIGNPAEVAAAERRRDAAHARRSVRTRERRAPPRRSRVQPAMSWECRAADGEVFYRHKRCPSSIPGDGVVRTDYAEQQARQTTRGRRHNAWSRVRVHGVAVPRAEACRRIHSAGAAVRDGHLRDADVSTYDHLMGRDPCSR